MSQRSLIEISIKRCTACDQIKHFDCFYAEREGAGGKRSRCKQCMNASSWAGQVANRERANARRALPENRAKVAERARRRRLEQREHVLALQRKHNAARRLRPQERLRDAIGCQIRAALRGEKRGRGYLELVDWSVDELRTHLERQFLKGMSWGNYGKWHVDHIVPLSSFVITGPDDPELRRAWALPNLRPLWARDNESKGAKLQVIL